MTVKLSGPRLAPKSGRARQLVVFLHGYGADGKDLIELGQQWRALLPDAAFVAPNAADRCPGTPMGRQWFALSRFAPDDPRGAAERWQGAGAARPAIDAFLSEELARARPRRYEARARRLQPGRDDGDARRPATPACAGGDRLLFRNADRRRTSGRSQGAQRARRAAAHSARPWRSGRHDPVRGDVRRGERIRRGRDSQLSGTSRWASAMASTPARSGMAGFFSPRRSAFPCGEGARANRGRRGEGGRPELFPRIHDFK